MKRIRFVNWNEYQHYKDRNPPWIKLHFAILSSKAWVSLNSEGRELAIVCMLLASRNDGVVACDEAYVRRVAYLSKKPDFDALVRSELCVYETTLADASKQEQLLADASSSALLCSDIDKDILKKESEKENLFKMADGKAWADTWREWVACRMDKKKCKNWQRMFSGQIRMLCEVSDEVARKMMQQSIANDWQGLFPVKAAQMAAKSATNETPQWKRLELLEEMVREFTARNPHSDRWTAEQRSELEKNRKEIARLKKEMVNS